MIFGQGTASTDEAILAEYHQLLDAFVQARDNVGSLSRRSVRTIPLVMREKIHKPILEWDQEDIRTIYRNHPSTYSRTLFNRFLSFLLFRGYLRANLSLLTELNIHLAVQYRSLLTPYRERLSHAQKALGYRLNGTRVRQDGIVNDGTGSEMELYLWLLIVAHKTPGELTRADFESFWQDYQSWYRPTKRHPDEGNDPDPHLYRLERLLVHLGDLPAREKVGKTILDP